MIENIDKMNGWSIEELPNLVFFQEGPGVRNNQYTDSGVKLLNVANLKDGNVYLDNTDRYISEEEAYGKYSHFLVDEGDLIIASSGIKVEYFDKKMGFAKKEHLPLCMNTSTIRFKTLDDNILDIEYFAYFLKTNYFKKQISRLITGSAQLNFGPSHLKQIKVILPPIETQKKIVEVLDKAQELIDKRKEQIEALDELVKSRFIEMFGNPFIDEKNFGMRKLGEVTIVNPKKAEVKELDDKLNVSFVPMEKVGEKGEFNSEISKTIKELYSGFTYFRENDVLFAKITPCMENGKGAVATNLINGIGFGSTEFHVIRPIIEKSNPYWIYHLSTLIEFRRLAERKMTGSAGQKRVPTDFINNLKVVLPPIELQNQFADFVNQVDKLKSQMETSLKELEDNFNSLMQKAFKGELF